MQKLTREEEERFEEAHIQAIWEELHVRFGFNVKEWKAQFANYVIKQSRETSIMGCFYLFGNACINPVLNEILVRQRLHPTFTNLVKFVISKTNSPSVKKRMGS